MNVEPAVIEAALTAIQLEKRATLLRLIESVDGFSIKSGSLTLHFDGNGAIGSVEVHRRYGVK